MDLTPQQRDAVVRTVIGEAANQGTDGMAAVAAVILNRSVSGLYPSDPSLVVSQPNQFTANNSVRTGGNTQGRNARESGRVYQQAAAVVDSIFSGETPDPTNGAIFYHTAAVNPGWRGLTQTAHIGDHIFYTPPAQQPRIIAAQQIATQAQVPATTAAEAAAQLAHATTPAATEAYANDSGIYQGIYQTAAPQSQPKPATMTADAFNGTFAATAPTRSLPPLNAADSLAMSPALRGNDPAPVFDAQLGSDGQYHLPDQPQAPTQQSGIAGFESFLQPSASPIAAAPQGNMQNLQQSLEQHIAAGGLGTTAKAPDTIPTPSYNPPLTMDQRNAMLAVPQTTTASPAAPAPATASAPPPVPLPSLRPGPQQIESSPDYQRGLQQLLAQTRLSDLGLSPAAMAGVSGAATYGADQYRQNYEAAIADGRSPTEADSIARGIAAQNTQYAAGMIDAGGKPLDQTITDAATHNLGLMGQLMFKNDEQRAQFMLGGLNDIPTATQAVQNLYYNTADAAARAKIAATPQVAANGMGDVQAPPALTQSPLDWASAALQHPQPTQTAALPSPSYAPVLPMDQRNAMLAVPPQPIGNPPLTLAQRNAMLAVPTSQPANNGGIGGALASAASTAAGIGGWLRNAISAPFNAPPSTAKTSPGYIPGAAGDINSGKDQSQLSPGQLPYFGSTNSSGGSQGTPYTGPMISNQPYIQATPAADLLSIDAGTHIPSITVPKYIDAVHYAQVPMNLPIETTPDATWVPDPNDPNGGEYVMNATPQVKTVMRSVPKTVSVINPKWQQQAAAVAAAKAAAAKAGTKMVPIAAPVQPKTGLAGILSPIQEKNYNSSPALQTQYPNKVMAAITGAANTPTGSIAAQGSGSVISPFHSFAEGGMVQLWH